MNFLPQEMLDQLGQAKMDAIMGRLAATTARQMLWHLIQALPDPMRSQSIYELAINDDQVVITMFIKNMMDFGA